MALLSTLAMEITIPVCTVLGMVCFLVWCFLKQYDHPAQYDLTLETVAQGVTSFRLTEYWYAVVFVVAFAITIFLSLGSVDSFNTQSQPCVFDPSNTCKPAVATAVFSTVSFLLGALASVLFGFLGMEIATYANKSIASEASNGIGRTFIAAFRSCAVMGFILAANDLLLLYIAISLFKLYYGNDWQGLFEAITGYGLGGSSMALFRRAGGGTYAKAATVCDDGVLQRWRGGPRDARNPAVIPNNVGDYVGDIAGTGTDLFAGSSCAALVVASISSFEIDHDFTFMCYPLLISSMGILVCLITTLFVTFFLEITTVEEIERALKNQLIISTILMTVGITVVSWIALPSSFTIYDFGSQKVVMNWQLFSWVVVGLCTRPISWIVLECSHNHPNRLDHDGARNADQDGAGNAEFGLAYVIIPIFAVAISISVSYRLAATYGIAVVAIGMLSTFTGLAIDAYGPICNSAQGIARMAGTNRQQETIDVLDDAGKSIAAIGKVFAIGSAALVSLALFCAFVSRAAISRADCQTVKFFIGLIGGAVLPYCFSAMTEKTVKSAGSDVADQILEQDLAALESGHERPDHAAWVKNLSDAAFRGMIGPVALVVFTPLIVGIFFGVEMLSGVLAGSLLYVVLDGAFGLRRAADWLDANLLNVLIQLIAVESLMFARFFTTPRLPLFKIF